MLDKDSHSIYIVYRMFNDDGELSPDLVWMLQSNQIYVDALIEALVSSYYQQIYTSALSELTYPEEAHRAAQDTFVLAIIRKRDYRGKNSVQDWLDSIASGIIAEYKSNIRNFQFLNPKLIRSIRSQQPENTLSNRQIHQAIKGIKSKVKGSRSSRSKKAYFQLIGLTIFVVLAAYFFLTSSKTLVAENPGDLALPTDEFTIRGDVDTPLSLRGKSTPTKELLEGAISEGELPPLSTESSPETIKERVLLSSQLWNTMWADIVVSFYGPAAYVGPPFNERHQLWIDKVDGDFEIIGPPQGIPDSIENIILSSENSPNRLGFLDITDYAKLGSVFPWYSIKTETIFLFPFAINYFFNTIDQNIFLNSNLSVTGEEIIADREAVIIELTSPEGKILARLWLDAHIGITLREQFYDPHGIEKVIIESRLRKILFDDSTPTRRKETDKSTFSAFEIYPGLNDPSIYSNSTVLDYPMLGFPMRPPPPGFDNTRARISFAKADHTNLVTKKTGKYQIFADNYFLGNIEMIDPLKMICDRSMDGTKIAMSNWGIFPTDVKNKIYWLDLNNLDFFTLNIPNTIVFWTRFSPDNEKIVVSGYNERDGEDRFLLIDSKTGEYKLLPINTGFSSIAWSPDGTEIAILDLSFSPTDFKSSTRIRVFDVKTGDEKRMFISRQVSQGSPKTEVFLDGWTAEFYSQLQDLSHCASSP